MGPVVVKINKIMIILSIIFTFLSSTFSTPWSAEKDMVLKFQDQALSAFLQGVPLRLVLEELGRETGIWFRGDSSLLREERTVQFTSLSLEDGVKRILSSMNYSLVFNRDGELDGVVIISRVPSSVAQAGDMTAGAGKSISSTPPKEQVSTIGVFEEVNDSYPLGGTVSKTDKDLESFTVMRNIPPPGGSVEVTVEEREDFTVIRNCPPSGS
jgi:hypothetical protein